MEKNSYNIPNAYETVVEVLNAANKIHHNINSHDLYDKLDTVEPEKLGNVIYLSEKIALSLRNKLSENTIENEKNVDYLDQFFTYDNMVSVYFDGNALVINTPFTFKRFYREGNEHENYLMMNYIKSALNRWQKNNNFDLYRSIQQPLTVMIIRKGNTFNRTKICDNDNLENGRIINELFEVLGYSDSAFQTDLFSCFRLIDDNENEGMQFRIISSKDIYSQLDLINKNT